MTESAGVGGEDHPRGQVSVSVLAVLNAGGGVGRATMLSMGMGAKWCAGADAL